MTDQARAVELLYAELDEIARDCDKYDYGLPYDDTWRARGLALITQALEAAVTQERERCQKAICPYCNDPAWTLYYTGTQEHESPITGTRFPCKSAALRQPEAREDLTRPAD